MTQAIITGTVVALVSVLLHAISYAVFNRRYQAHDADRERDQKRIATLEAGLETVRDREIAEIKKGLSNAAARRKTMYETLEEDYVKDRDCQRQQSRVNETLEDIRRGIRSINAHVTELASETAKNSQAIGMICQHMQISIGKDTPHASTS